METVTLLKQWRARQLIYHPSTDDLEKTDIGLEELESNIAHKQAGINVRIAQVWAKRMREDPEWDIHEKLTNKVNCAEFQLQEEHIDFLINLFDKQLQTTRKNTVNDLTTAFESFSLKSERTSGRNFHQNERNLTAKRITRRSVARNSEELLIKRKEWIEKWT
ncbi:hypothetical protein INT46_001670 [Mucor plumbeus]|uniref:Uncharacterized protein n=1 Tax=Mucor plumbeus TaxID=97098 RepID=A0A8H7QEG5_9FUNG|nr:hypothetical protein INT46_001670 [Mucor plumbeus]